jgi:Cd2+/Zn2+-exporting ATPase
MRKTSGSVRELMELAPAVAHVVSPDGSTVDVQTKGVEEGYTIRVLAGERIPLDGIIVRGSSSFNEAPVTGESMPQDKGVGSEVFAGSLNTNAVVDVRVTADEDCTTLARIVSQVQGAQAQKAPYESFVNRFAAAYTPVVILGALVLGICVPLTISLMRGSWDGALWHDWVYRACSLLVVACPCALVISTPVSFVSALTRAAKSGVLVKGGAFFDIATHVTHVTFDKTGTLTTGNPAVTQVVTLGPTGEDEVLALGAALEAASTHPLARAVVAAAQERGLSQLDVTSVEETAAHGIRGMVGTRSCAVGKAAFACGSGAADSGVVDSCVEEVVEMLGAAGATALVVSCDGEALGVIGVADTLRSSASATVAALGSGRVARTVEMLTGDNNHVADAVAKELGVSDVRSGLMPEDKLTRIGELQEQGAVVAMVGDGINDAPALAKADLGITMGAAASDTALEVADVALLSDSLELLPAFFNLAERTMNIVRENIAFAIGVKVLVFVLVALGFAGMGAAVFADTGVALIVVLNGMRLMRASKWRW